MTGEREDGTFFPPSRLSFTLSLCCAKLLSCEQQLASQPSSSPSQGSFSAPLTSPPSRPSFLSASSPPALCVPLPTPGRLAMRRPSFPYFITSKKNTSEKETCRKLTRRHHALFAFSSMLSSHAEAKEAGTITAGPSFLVRLVLSTPYSTATKEKKKASLSSRLTLITVDPIFASFAPLAQQSDTQPSKVVPGGRGGVGAGGRDEIKNERLEVGDGEEGGRGEKKERAEGLGDARGIEGDTEVVGEGEGREDEDGGGEERGHRKEEKSNKATLRGARKRGWTNRRQVKNQLRTVCPHGKTCRRPASTGLKRGPPAWGS